MNKTTTHEQEKEQALWIIVRGFLLITLGLISYQYSPEGGWGTFGFVLSLVGVPIWIYGFVKYSQAKGRSELAAIILSLLWPIGLVVLMLLQDLKKPVKQKKSRS